jgi:tol-pal system protein YbgF
VRTRWIVLGFGVLFVGAVLGAALAPPPAGAVNRDLIQLQQQMSQVLQNQQDLRSALDSNSATLRTLVQQSLDAVNQLNGQMVSVQKAVQEVQANSGARIDSMTQQQQGVSDNLQDVQARVGKLAQQMTDVQNLLQSIDSKVSGGATGSGSAPGTTSPGGYGSTPGGYGSGASAPAGGPGNGGGLPPISADTLYQNGLRDFTSGRYDLAHQEFSDYIAHFPSNDLASNAQFYLGEISYAQNNFRDAVTAYENVLTNYPKSFKIAASLMKKGTAELELGQKAAGIRDLRDVIRRFPGSDEARRAQAKLHEIGASSTAGTASRH